MANNNRSRTRSRSNRNTKISNTFNKYSSKSKPISNHSRVEREEINREVTKKEAITFGIILLLVILGIVFLGWFLTLILFIGCSLIYIIIKKLINQKNQKRKKIATIALTAFLLACIAAVAGLCVFMGYIAISAPKFDKNKLNQKESTIIYDADGKEITKLGAEMRENITYDNLSESLINALIATEDSRFFDHNGVDIPRFVTASIKQVLGQSNAGGASTLSMQLAKNKFNGDEARGIEGIVRKFKDIYVAVFKIEKNYTKEEIIEMYLNSWWFAQDGDANYGGICGVEQASQYFFGKSVSDLSLPEAAMLVGMVNNPVYYNPYIYPEMINLFLMH